VSYRRLLVLVLWASAALTCWLQAQTPNPTDKSKAPASDIELVERVLLARREYQKALEMLRHHYIKAADVEKSRWAEEELIQYHRILHQPYRLDLDVPPPTLRASVNIPEANKVYARAMTFKDKGSGTDYIDNQRRAEILFQQILSRYPQSTMIDRSAYMLGDIYESKSCKQYRRAAMYFERCFQWNINTQSDARLRAARLYDHQLLDRVRAMEIYKEILNTEHSEPKRIEEATKRLQELSGGSK
jgi:tetratricopeptide (TPR) repeat protein